ncbi:hypothetical protein [Nostoc sp. UHCC 0870]|uniref:hypothetical protein n=1 Tax=Nostoc sp. UHCC 0870 TaxID=2914041 RepID=UPI001EDED9B6|nr:hypothetical protein [Nostoc sp. UHCC 0870]UKP01511.1 hypothetical protein L6494_30240 [Nostoc sp. UHCC 0870]
MGLFLPLHPTPYTPQPQRGLVNLSPALANWLQLMTEPSLKRRLKSAVSALDALEQVKKSQSALEQVKKSRLVSQWEGEGRKRVLRWDIHE